MKRGTILYIWLWVVTIIIIIGYALWPSHHELASDPHKIGAIVNLRLPDIADYQYEDNLDRGASRWDFFEHHTFFSEELSEECIAEMERRCVEDSEHWSKEESEESGEFYLYMDMDEDLYEVGCAIYKDQVHVGYLIDEDEGILVILLISVLTQILFIWGLVLIIIKIVCKRTAKQIKQHELENHNEAE